MDPRRGSAQRSVVVWVCGMDIQQGCVGRRVNDPMNADIVLQIMTQYGRCGTLFLFVDTACSTQICHLKLETEGRGSDSSRSTLTC